MANWRPYQNWLGAYGAQGNDFVTVAVHQKQQQTNGDIIYGFDLTPDTNEFSKFTQFTKQQKFHPRYGLLTKPASEPNWPFDPKVPAILSDAFDYSPHRRLGIGLTFHNARSLAQRISKTKLFADYPANLIFNLLGCPSQGLSELNSRLLTAYNQQPALTSLFPMGEYVAKIHSVDNSELIQPLLLLTGQFAYAWKTDHTERFHKPTPGAGSYPSIGFYAMDKITTMVGASLLRIFTKMTEILTIIPSHHSGSVHGKFLGRGPNF